MMRWAALAVAVAALGVAAGCGAVEEQAAAPAAQTEAPAPPDTGRMSDGEHALARSAVLELDGEIDDYTATVGDRCAVIVRGGQFAEALDCIEGAYDGVEAQASLTYSTLDDLRVDVDKQCRAALGRAVQVVDTPLFQALGASKIALDSLEGELITAGQRRLSAQNVRWQRASVRMLAACSPG